MHSRPAIAVTVGVCDLGVERVGEACAGVNTVCTTPRYEVWRQSWLQSEHTVRTAESDATSEANWSVQHSYQNSKL